MTQWTLPDHVYCIAEIGVNHDGSLEKALRLIDSAVAAGADAVKLQIRSPRVSVPREQWDVPRVPPWGGPEIPYIEYKERMEFTFDDYVRINNYCQAQDIEWSASVWDIPSLEFLMQFDPPWVKVPSAMLTNHELLNAIHATGKPAILSTGMSTPHQIDAAVDIWENSPQAHNLLIAHCTSTYPAEKAELNLRMIVTLGEIFDESPIGYSGHEVGLATTVAAVALGARFVERHITLDRTSRGTDHAASVEPQGLKRLVDDIRSVEASLGDGVKRVYDSEIPVRDKLRGRDHANAHQVAPQEAQG
jgi:N-acetylneuraminate synthase